MKKPIVLIVLDGYGLAPKGPGNCIGMAKKPNLDYYWKNFPHTKLEASGEHVGSVPGSQGTSEIGHLHMGAGRIVWQPLPRINREIKNGQFFRNKALLGAMKRGRKARLHLLGLCSDGNVHSNINHLFALLDMAKGENVKDVFIHCFIDGRDVGERTAEKYISQTESECSKLKLGKIATIVGRYYSMDRDKNYSRTKVAYDVMTIGKGMKAASPIDGIKRAYALGDRTDYYVRPILVDRDGLIKDRDACVFFNYRTDRARQITYPFVLGEFHKFKREKRPKTYFVCFSHYDEKLKVPVAFPEVNVTHNLGKVLADHGKRQLRIAETEKYAHVTYFFNSQVERPNKGEDRVLVPSSKVPSYDQKPEMSAEGIAERAVTEMGRGKYDFILINFANCDLVGHSANIKAIVKAVEVVDECVGKVVTAALNSCGIALITADHGSAEEKKFPNGEPKPSHSCNLVPFIIVSRGGGNFRPRKSGGLIDVAPTILDLMGVRKPKEMKGRSLIIGK